MRHSLRHWGLALAVLLLGAALPVANGLSQTQPPAPLRCPTPLSDEAKRLQSVFLAPSIPNSERLAALKAQTSLPGAEAPCAMVELLCQATDLPSELRNALELGLVDLGESVLLPLASLLDTSQCSQEAAAAFLSRVMRRTPDVLAKLCSGFGPQTCFAVSLGIAASGHPQTGASLATLYDTASSPESRAALLQAICPQLGETCATLLPKALAPESPAVQAAAGLVAFGALRQKSLAPLVQPWLSPESPELLLLALESLSMAGSHGVESRLFELLTLAPATLRDPILLALAAGDPDTARPFLQRAFASVAPTTPEQQRLAQWVLADTPDILFRGNSPETTPVYAQAAPHLKGVCLLTLRNQEGMRVAVDGKLRLICGSASRTFEYAQSAFLENGTLEFPCVCDGGRRPESSWITPEEVVLEVHWKE